MTTLTCEGPTPVRKVLHLTPLQGRVLTQRHRFRVWVAGRRSGKTFTSCAFLLDGAINKAPDVNAFIAPTYKQAKRVVWDEMLRMIPRKRVAKISEGALTIWFHPSRRFQTDRLSSISLFGADNPDSMRGIGMGRFVMDEYADMDPRTFPEVVRPMLATTKGDGMFIGTPKGFNHFHKLYQDARVNHLWFALQSTTLEGGLVPPSEIKAAMNDMSLKQFKQEFMASFEALTARVYHAFDRSYNCSNSIVFDPRLDVLVGIDFNVSPGMHGVVGQRVGDQVHIVDEIFIPDGNTEEFAREVVRRFGAVMVNGAIHRPKLIAYPDPTGKRRQTSAQVGVTDHSILRSYGFTVRTPNAPYAQEDKHNTVNAALRTASGRTRLFIHPRCNKLITGFEGLTYKEDTMEPNKKLNIDHAPDACAYLTCIELPMTNRIVLNTELDL